MKSLAKKVSSLLPVLEPRGPVYLFALFEREDIPGKWDIVLSSDWSDRQAGDAIRFISEQIVPTLQPDELAALSRIVVIPSKDPGVLAMTSAADVTAGSLELFDGSFNGLQVQHALVFLSKRPGGALPETTANAAGASSVRK